MFGSLLKMFAILALLALVGVCALLAAMRIERDSDTVLPKPTGSFAVGRTSRDWIDKTHTDKLAPRPGTRRELIAWIWYPAQASAAAATTADYLPAPWRAAIEQDRGAFVSKFLTRDLARVRTHSLRDPPMSSRQPSYPVVIMRAGLAAETLSYSTLAEDLASHGYVVVGFDAPYRTGLVVLPDGRVIEEVDANNADLVSGRAQNRLVDNLIAAWTADTGFALDRLQQLNASDPSGRFTGRLDLTRVGVFGHSLGGATAAEFCQQDARCKAGIDIDGALHCTVIHDGIGKPFMFLLSDHHDASDAQNGRIEAEIHSVYDRLPPNQRLLVTIRGANHFSFSDDAALLKSHIVLRGLRALGILGIDGRRQLAVTAYCIHRFFDAYLKRADASPPAISSARYPEIEVMTLGQVYHRSNNGTTFSYARPRSEPDAVLLRQQTTTTSAADSRSAPASRVP